MSVLKSAYANIIFVACDSDSQRQHEVAEQHKELEVLRSKVEELNRQKRELEKRLRHLPTNSLKAKLLENVKVGGKMFSK